MTFETKRLQHIKVCWFFYEFSQSGWFSCTSVLIRCWPPLGLQ